METFIVVLLGFAICIFIIRQIGKQKEEDNGAAIKRGRDAHTEKQITFFKKVPEGNQFVFVDPYTFNVLIVNSKHFLLASEVPADLRVLRPGVIGYIYGYGVIVDEELAGTYL